jgi:hypothetical protein
LYIAGYGKISQKQEDEVSPEGGNLWTGCQNLQAWKLNLQNPFFFCPESVSKHARHP